MALHLIQRSMFDAAALVSQHKLDEASELLGGIIAALFETRNMLVTCPEGLNSFEATRANELTFIPISKEFLIARPDWDDEFFAFPFAFVDSNFANHWTTPFINEQIVSTCAAACLFNLGLCSHMETKYNAEHCAVTLRDARTFYENAWIILKRFSGDSTPRGNSITYLLMALCTNLSKCCYDLGELDSSNQWQESLLELLTFCWHQEDNSALELHNFFLLTSAINAGYFAAGAA